MRTVWCGGYVGSLALCRMMRELLVTTLLGTGEVRRMGKGWWETKKQEHGLGDSSRWLGFAG